MRNPTTSEASLKESLFARAEELGFQRIGVARAEPLSPEGERLKAWLVAGRHGEMAYMEETPEVRTDVRHAGMLPSAESVIVVAMSYARAEPPQGPVPGRVARYAQGRDYHNVLDKRVRKLAKMLRAAGYATRSGVDSWPVFERAWAQRAGLGFIGKNCCLIIPGLGSHVLLATLVTAAALPPDQPMRERCGECTACLTACPTQAFVAPRQLDGTRCISYLTIEQRGSVPEALRPALGNRIFGCDVCQDVCPFNRTAPVPEVETAAFRADARWQNQTAADLLTMNEAEFTSYADGSPLRRAGRIGMARNAALVLGNSNDKRHLPVLDAAAQQHDSGVVRDAAAWATRQLRADADVD